MNRRDMLKTMATGAAMTSLPAVATAATLPTDAPEVAGDSPLWLLAPLQVGQELGLGWTLAGVSPGTGAWVVHLAQGAESARVHMHYHRGQPKGVAHTQLLDLVLMDGGDGDRSTEESLGRVVRRLAQLVSVNELREGADQAISALLTHGERIDRFGPEAVL